MSIAAQSCEHEIVIDMLNLDRSSCASGLLVKLLRVSYLRCGRRRPLQGVSGSLRMYGRSVDAFVVKSQASHDWDHPQKDSTFSGGEIGGKYCVSRETVIGLSY